MDNAGRHAPASSLERDSSMPGQMVLPLGEALEGQPEQQVRPVSRSQRQRHWDEEHDRLDLLWRQGERSRALAEFRAAALENGWDPSSGRLL